MRDQRSRVCFAGRVGWICCCVDSGGCFLDAFAHTCNARPQTVLTAGCVLESGTQRACAEVLTACCVAVAAALICCRLLFHLLPNSTQPRPLQLFGALTQAAASQPQLLL